MPPHPLTPQPEWHHLPRLDLVHYQGFSAVFWTLTLERRAVGWLDDAFHQHFRELLLHVAAREGLYCPVYTLMPDHLHVVWLGLRVASDQLRAVRFLRKYLQRELTRRSSTGGEFELQKQAHDAVLKEQDRTRGALAKACFYVLENPCRQGLVEHARQWPHLGAMAPGYPFLHPLDDDFWPAYWKLYREHREPARSPSP